MRTIRAISRIEARDVVESTIGFYKGDARNLLRFDEVLLDYSDTALRRYYQPR